MSVPAATENVAIARQAVAGLAEAVGMPVEHVADLKTVVSEACMNAVLHAYPDAEGGLVEVAAHPGDDDMEVVIRDFGSGIQPRPMEGDRPTLRLGLPLIAALAHSFEIRGGAGRGTEIRVRFGLEEARRDTVTSELDTTGSNGAAVVAVRAGQIARPVLARVVSLLAARAELPIDRVNDAVLLSDAISAEGTEENSDAVRLEITDSAGGLELRVGPLAPGGAAKLTEGLRLPGIGSLEVLADGISVESDAEGNERLVLSLRRDEEPDEPGPPAPSHEPVGDAASATSGGGAETAPATSVGGGDAPDASAPPPPPPESGPPGPGIA